MRDLSNQDRKLLYIAMKGGIRVDGMSIETIDYNNCAIRAVRDATGISYEVLDDMFSKYGRRFNSGTPFKTTEKVLNKLGYQLFIVTPRFKSRTVRTLQRELRYDHCTYLVRVRDHILCVRNGLTKDWADQRLNRILEIYKVVKI